MAVPFSTIVTQALEAYGSKIHFDALRRASGIVSAFGDHDGIVFQEGGAENFVESVMYAQNTNVAARGINAQITTVDDEFETQAKTPQRVVNGSIVFNQIRLDQISGDAKLTQGLIEDKTRQFSTTHVQVIADLLRQATPAGTDPFTLLPDANTGTVNGILIDRTPAQQGTDAATTAGISRGDNSWWRNQYSTTAYDLTTQAGRRGLYLDVYAPTVRGSGGSFEPNVAPCSTVIIASLGSEIDENKRALYSDSQDKEMKFGFQRGLYFYNALLVRDSSSRFLNGTSGKIAFLSVGKDRALMIKVLKGQGKVTKEMLNQNNNLGSLPIYWKHKQMSDIDSLNYVTIGYVTFNLVPRGLQDLGLADNCT